MAVRKRVTLIELLIVVAMGGIVLSLLFGDRSTRATAPAPAPASTATPPATATPAEIAEAAALSARLTPRGPWREGLAAVVLVDVSGSMRDRVRDASGERRRKLEIAQRAAAGVVEAFAAYARERPELPVMVGVYEFSQRERRAAARPVVVPGPPDAEAARRAIYAMKANGGTPIGDAMVEARLALDATGLSRRHLLVLTDGENTDGTDPALVARVLERQTGAARAALYFIAFDVDAKAFAGVRDAGALLLPARDGGELAATFAELLSDRILVEAPRAPVEAPGPR